MRWSSLLFEVVELPVLQFGFPDAIVLQLGENDIPAFKRVALQNAMREDLQLLRPQDAKSKLFWSCLLEAEDLEETPWLRPELTKSGPKFVGPQPGCRSPLIGLGARTSGCLMSAMLCWSKPRCPH
uniref:Uncharacterized protein n=1 Tax=Sphaerodactylus townsendi TaxID=933632 RepID=A0ACB8EKW7_9SAUR